MRTVYYNAEDKGRGNRAILAVAGSIALHEIIAGIIIALALYQGPTPAPDKVIAQRITVIVRHRPTPPPTPAPTPVPTPKPTPQMTPTPRIALTTRVYNAARPKAAATPAQHQGGAAAPRHRAIVAPPRLHLSPSIAAPQHVAVAARSSSQNGNAAGQANGGSGTGGGPGSGNGGAGGSGSGTGGNGTNPGQDVPLSPCGAVYLDEVRKVTNPDGSQYEQVQVRVQLNNGSELRDTLHWFFYYKTAADNPFNDPHQERAPLQFPPKGYDVAANQESATTFVLKHTRPNGHTDLPDCPTQTTSKS